VGAILRELFYCNADKIMAADVKSDTTFVAGTLQMLFEKAGV